MMLNVKSKGFANPKLKRAGKIKKKKANISGFEKIHIENNYSVLRIRFMSERSSKTIT